MAKLAQRIRNLVNSERFIVGIHARDQMKKRGIMLWQAASGLEDAELIVERPRSKPNPSIEVRQFLPDGTSYKAVWSVLERSNVAKLVTVHFFDRPRQ